ncbi:MAG TPA: Holliday junction branch migration protein RuvA [Desulfobacteria bacterium]|nr:Holliday junction branch migration protein RuvA [Desulfobacteria bacterium]
MIAFLKGVVVSTGSDNIILEVNGIGYKIYVPAPVVGSVSGNAEQLTVYTYMNVREDAIQLYGFLNTGDLEMFELLIQVSGIGPKVGLTVLSSMSGSAFVQAILHEQLDILTSIPGVGKKTAQRMIIELKDKISKMGIISGESQPGAQQALPDAANDAMQALTALGYNPVEAKRALRKIVLEENRVCRPEELIKLALKELGRL